MAETKKDEPAFDGTKKLSRAEVAGLRSLEMGARSARARAAELAKEAQRIDEEMRACFEECVPDADLTQPVHLDAETRELRYHTKKKDVAHAEVHEMPSG